MENLKSFSALSSKKFLVFIIIVILLITILPGQITNTVPLETSLLFFVIAMFSVIGIIRELGYAAVTLNMIHWIFTLIFFFVAPLTQVTFGFSGWEFTTMDNDNVTKSCLMIILWIVVYSLSGSLIGKKIHLSGFEQREKISSGWLHVFTFISLVCGISIVVRYGFSNMFARVDMKAGEDAIEMSTATSLVWSKVSRATIVFTEVLLIMTAIRKEIKINKLLLVNTVVLLISCFPTAISRNESAAIYLGLFVVFFYRDLKTFKQKPWYILCFLGATMLLFPLVNVFRRFSFGDENLTQRLSEILQNLNTVFLAESYDAFSIIEGARKYVEVADMTYGYQLLGSLFFFVPRSVWVTKPIGSGAMIASAAGQGFTNISCPLIAEGYVNFGILGVILFAFITGTLCTVVDRKYWENAPENQKFSLIKILYPVLPPYFFFMLRGDLMSSFAYTSAYVVTFWFLFGISRWHINIGK